jgi:hypothetical protein
MSVKVAIAALASYELSHEYRSRQFALSAKNSRLFHSSTIHKLRIPLDFEPNCELVRH